MTGSTGVCGRGHYTTVLLCVALPWLAEAAPAAWADARGPDGTRPGVAVIFGTDDRRLVGDTTVLPFSAIGLIEADYGTELRTGTGALIGEKTVLTTAHVLYDRQLGWAHSVQFTPGMQGAAEPFGRLGALRLAVPDEWVTQGAEGFDLGLLELDSSVGGQTGYFKIVSPPVAFFDGAPLESAGYPSDLGGVHMYAVTGLAEGVDGMLFLHTIDTEPGQSGSPVWAADSQGDQLELVGVLKGSRQISGPLTGVQVQGVGVRIVPEFAAWIEDFLAQVGDARQDVTEPAFNRIQDLCGTCGAGTGQAFVLLSLGWCTLRLVRRDRRF